MFVVLATVIIDQFDGHDTYPVLMIQHYVDYVKYALFHKGSDVLVDRFESHDVLSDFVGEELESLFVLDLVVEVANVVECVLGFIGGCILDVEGVEELLHELLVVH